MKKTGIQETGCKLVEAANDKKRGEAEKSKKYPSFEELFRNWNGEGAPEGEFQWFECDEPQGNEEW